MPALNTPDLHAGNGLGWRILRYVSFSPVFKAEEEKRKEQLER